MKKSVVGSMSDWSGVLKDVYRQIDDGSLTLGHFRALAEHRNPFAVDTIQQEWQEFYRKYFRMNVDFSEVFIPDDPGGYERIIFISQGLNIASIIKVMRKYFTVCFYNEDLDMTVK
ncbi:MAG: hypothetical protein COX77_00830 [Candidatus Komeilibacteria bacterium CG_4_10_14_0_2_um_filter_37_10]|uniref:Uncharacterized protein n=1 Tax=Candidatus Komeilibacteria bacterium CG_4_10_14_0_2_um_filter_37_10 TaxID=1974470 RepID=A0A2M7VGD9_9BACT|nr:MAG: hypothetical protein COX77_00830 [Candidatus Komeilibacteria bacterium CG_4_10_14_0_2_um_filter_37_10]PJA94100.1 MAG: hypothetical protein CO133_00720 [Candidatus Komeilibacteria bacterium CG_4_9_14_3_um_filter_37_5]